MSFVIEVASVPDRDQLVAEIWWNGVMVAELRRGADAVTYVDLYSPPSDRAWSFELDGWLQAIEAARERLR